MKIENFQNSQDISDYPIALSKRMVSENSHQANQLFAPCVRSACKNAIDFIALIAMVDRRGRVFDANTTFRQSYSGTRNPIDLSVHDLVQADGLHVVRTIFRNVRRDGQWRGEVLARRSDRSDLWVDLTVTPEKSIKGKTVYFHLVALDITERKVAEIRAREECAKRMEVERLLADILDTIPNGVVASEEDGRVVFVNAAHVRMFGRDSSAAEAGQPFPDDLTGQRRRRRGSDRAVKQGKDRRRSKFLYRATSGRWVQVENKCSVSGRSISVQTEVTSLKRAERQIREQATRDPLTGVSNRLAVFNRLDRFINTSKDRQRTCAVLLLDLDDFKSINDSYGHEAGDLYLKEVAKRLTRSLRRSDTVARLGGDEFAVVLPGLKGSEDAVPVLEKVRQELAKPLSIGKRIVLPSASMGLACFPRDGAATMELMRSADQALYHCIHHARGGYSIFDHTMRAKAARRARLIEELRTAVASGEFNVVLQPQRNMLTGAHHGFEALVRWRASGGAVPPAEVISVAEESGLVAKLSYGIIEKVLAIISEVKAKGLCPGVISFNTVASQLYDPDFPNILTTLLKKYGVAPSEVELEVTENVILDRSADLIAEALRSLRNAGFSIALDDFGTGYASLTHLKQLPIDKLKIDRSFVSGIMAGPQGQDLTGGDYIISRTIVSLAHNLGFKVVAEGIETEEQFRELKKIGCDIGQGYLLGRPLSHPDVISYLRSSSSERNPPPLRKSIGWA